MDEEISPRFCNYFIKHNFFANKYGVVVQFVESYTDGLWSDDDLDMYQASQIISREQNRFAAMDERIFISTNKIDPSRTPDPIGTIRKGTFAAIVRLRDIHAIKRYAIHRNISAVELLALMIEVLQEFDDDIKSYQKLAYDVMRYCDVLTDDHSVLKHGVTFDTGIVKNVWTLIDLVGCVRLIRPLFDSSRKGYIIGIVVLCWRLKLWNVLTAMCVDNNFTLQSEIAANFSSDQQESYTQLMLINATIEPVYVQKPTRLFELFGTTNMLPPKATQHLYYLTSCLRRLSAYDEPPTNVDDWFKTGQNISPIADVISVLIEPRWHLIPWMRPQFVERLMEICISSGFYCHAIGIIGFLWVEPTPRMMFLHECMRAFPINSISDSQKNVNAEFVELVLGMNYEVCNLLLFTFSLKSVGRYVQHYTPYVNCDNDQMLRACLSFWWTLADRQQLAVMILAAMQEGKCAKLGDFALMDLTGQFSHIEPFLKIALLRNRAGEFLQKYWLTFTEKNFNDICDFARVQQSEVLLEAIIQCKPAIEFKQRILTTADFAVEIRREIKNSATDSD
jgi:hypothetical protein